MPPVSCGFRAGSLPARLFSGGWTVCYQALATWLRILALRLRKAVIYGVVICFPVAAVEGSTRTKALPA